MDKAKLDKRFNALKSEYRKWEPAHKELSTYINPIRGQFSSTNTRGAMIDHQTLLDSHAAVANRVLASGMQSGMTSPMRPWFRLKVANKEKNKVPSVRQWLDEVADLMRDVSNQSNTYDVFFSMYEELGQFGTACAIILEDYDKVIRLRNFTAGEYVLAMDEAGNINTFGREFEMTVDQMVRAFGEENCSASVQSMYTNGQLDNNITIRHLIQPNDGADVTKGDNKNMKFKSAYWEKSGKANQFLSETGFHEFPVLAPRWDTITTSTVYGYGPGWFACGDSKELQKTRLDRLIAQEKSYDPPMLEDSSVNGISNYLPGGKTKTNSNAPNTGARPAYQINPNLESMDAAINGLHEKIDNHFYVNIFRMMINFDKTNMTATEVAQREQENVMMMGPLLTRVNGEMLTNYVNRLYAIMDRNFLFPEPPEEIQGMDIKIEFVSVLAQAQKAVGGISIDRVIARIRNMAEMKPDVVDNFDFDEASREYADNEGTPAKLMIDKQIVAKGREQRAQAQQMMEQAAMVNQGADTAKKLSDSKMDQESILTRMMGA